MFLAFSTLIPVTPLNSPNSFRQWSYTLIGKLADIPDGLCCSFPKAVLVPFPSLYSKLEYLWGHCFSLVGTSLYLPVLDIICCYSALTLNIMGFACHSLFLLPWLTSSKFQLALLPFFIVEECRPEYKSFLISLLTLQWKFSHPSENLYFILCPVTSVF